MNQINKMKVLVNELNAASNSYYNTGKTIMDDVEFDEKIEILKKLENETGVILSNSPTHKVGSTVQSKLNKAVHKIPMLSLDKCHSVEELIDFAGNDNCYLSVKCDGLTTRLIYKSTDGITAEVIGAETRGDGITGIDILEHVKQFTNVPLTIPYGSDLIIDGESMIFAQDFKDICEKNPNEEFKNCRNLASGTLANLDTNITKQRHMRFIAWRVIEGFSGDSNFFKLKEAEKLGFTVVPMWTYSNNSSDKENLSAMLHNLRRVANEMGLGLDGAVMAKDSMALSKSMGRTEKFFRHSIAYKYDDEEYETQLTGVEWSVGKTGCITPTATFKAVDIDGSTVERASLCNLSIIKELGLTNNCTVYVKKCNCIIPKITRCDSDGDSAIIPPKYCPICSGATKVVKENESEVLVCTNDNCSGKLLGKLAFFVSKKAMDIDGLSEATLEFLINKGWVKKYADLYHLDQYANRWARCEGFGKKSVENILDAIEKSRNVDLAHFITALSIPNIGSAASKTIAEYCSGKIEKFLELWGDQFDWTNLTDFGSVMSQNLNDYIVHNYADIVHLAEEMHFVVEEKKTDNSLDGLKFCTTGTFGQSREELKKKLESKGAKFISSVSKNLDVLFCGDKAGSKLAKAQQLGIRIADEKELVKMIGE